MKPPKLVILILAGSVLLSVAGGCGSSAQLAGSFTSPDAIVSYQSSRIVLQERDQEWMLSMRVFASCLDLPCAPEQVDVVFFSRPNEGRYSDASALRIEAGGLRFEWPGPTYSTPEYSTDGGMERVRVRMSFSDFRDLAFADSVEGRLGPTYWELSYDDRAGLRSIVRQLE